MRTGSLSAATGIISLGMVPPKYFCPSIHRPHSDVPSLQIVMQPIGKPSGKVHASQPILAQKPRYPTEKARTGRFSRIEDIRDLGFLSERIPQTLGNPLDRVTSRGIPRFLCPILPFDVYLFREARLHAQHSPPPRRVIHAIVNGKNQLAATRVARGPQAKPRSRSPYAPRLVRHNRPGDEVCASARAPHEPRRRRALTAR